MPQAVTHILIPIILLSLFRDIFFQGKQREKFPLHYVLIGGLAGILPDLDIAIYYIFSFFGFTMKEMHRTFSHSIFFPLIFLVLGILFHLFKIRNKELGKHHLKIYVIFYVLTLGIIIHLILDAFLVGTILPLYPFSNFSFGLNLISYLPLNWQSSIIPVIDAGLLILWLIYLEVKHKVSDFI